SGYCLRKEIGTYEVPAVADSHSYCLHHLYRNCRKFRQVHMERPISTLNDITLSSVEYTLKEERHIERQPDIDLVQMLLKRQAELNSLLEITLAINKNSDASILYEMLEVVLRNNLNVGSMMMLVKQDKRFACVSRFGVPTESIAETQEMCTT